MSYCVTAHAAGPRRQVRLVAAAAAVGLASTAIVAAGAGTAGAAALPKAQSVGRFVDGAAGGNPIQSLADVKDARATAPGTTSVQNPLDVTAFNALNIPLTRVVSVPTNPTVDAGAVNQVASANTNGVAVGASGAVANDGGANLGGESGKLPSAATINLSAASVGSVPIPALGSAPALPSAAALGGLIGSVHAVYSRVSTASGGQIETPSSGVAGLTLEIGSPALANLLTQLKTTFASSSNPLVSLLNTANLPLGSSCALTAPTAADIKLASGSVIISSTGAKITIDVQALIKNVLGKDISALSTSNFDVVSFLVKNLPTILANGVGGLVTSTTTALASQLKACFPASAALVDPLLTGQGTIAAAINTAAAPFASAGGSGLTALTDGLKNLVKIGLNVQSGPGIQPRETTYAYESNLSATPNQSTPVVTGQTVVRAIEINVLNASGIPALPASGLPTLPGVNSANITQLAGKPAAAKLAVAPGQGALNVALANSAAGPSTQSPATVVPSTPTTSVPSTNIPTGIPAGQASGGRDGGLPVLPLVAILVLLSVGGGAFWQLRVRGHHQL